MENIFLQTCRILTTSYDVSVAQIKKATFTDKQFYESKGRMSHSSRFKDTAVNRICNSVNRAGYLKIHLRSF